MKARQILREYVRPSMKDKVGVIALCRDDEGKLFWYRVNANESIPDKEHGMEDIAIHIIPKPIYKNRKETSITKP